MEVYLVGGAVRDQLLHCEVTEKDWVVVGSNPEEMLQLGFIPVGSDFPVFLHPNTHEEYALARTERKSGRGYKGFTFYCGENVTLEEDLQRRDLTINAIAQDKCGQYIDPYGGMNDLQDKLLRHISPAFSEDPLRILRIARFMARFQPLGFRVADETLRLLKTMVSQGELHDLTKERVWQEFNLALSYAKPSAFFTTLTACGALKQLFPELTKPVVTVVDNAANDQIETSIRFAILLFSFKNQTNPIKLIKHFCKIWRIPKTYEALAVLVVSAYDDLLSFSMQGTDLLALFIKTDALRRKDRFLKFLTAAKYCAPAEIQASLAAYTEILDKALQGLCTLSLEDKVDLNDKIHIKENVHQARLNFLNNFLKLKK